MDLNEDKAAMQKKQPTIYDNDFKNYIVLTFRRVHAHSAHHVICIIIRRKINRRFEVLIIEDINLNPRKF